METKLKKEKREKKKKWYLKEVNNEINKMMMKMKTWEKILLYKIPVRYSFKRN